jgi:hypothetical protein
MDYYDKVELLLPFKGANAGTSFPDLGVRNRTVTLAAAGVTTSTAQAKDYATSGYFNGSGYLTLPTNVDLHTAAGNAFCIEAWIHIANYQGARNQYGQVIFSDPFQGANGDHVFSVTTAGKLLYLRNTGVGSAITITGSTDVPTGQWAHVALSCDGTTWRLFLNGTVDATSTTNPFWVNGPTGLESIGRIFLNGSFFELFVGYMQDFRITKGHARYTANFTPPAKMLGVISGTIIGLDGEPAERTICAVPRAMPIRGFTTVSDDEDGTYSLDCLNTEMSRIVLADEADLYHDIIDRILPG